jgi:hypothetical protein
MFALGDHVPPTLPPDEWWRRAKAFADICVGSLPVRPYRMRKEARSRLMHHIINRAREHPDAAELLRLIYESGWNV